jgi:hypothetical protein
LLTGGGAVAEIQFDSANMIRLRQNSEVRLVDLAYHRAQIQVATGTVTFRVLRDSDSQMEIDTPQVSVRPDSRGTYRITIRQDGTSEIIIRSGEAEIFTPRGSEPLGTGQMMIARGSAADPEYQQMSAPALDDWDRWNENRDQYFERARTSYQYVNPDIYGAEELDDSGEWVNSQYGYAWHPRVAADWAPYRYGRWGWEDYYGWTWISDDPWGWAPYHYGNWFYDASVGWCWYPGVYRYPHYYWSPALVAFIGFGHGFGFGFGFGNIGWIPIAPFEPCYRWWGGGLYSGLGGFGGFNRAVINNTTIVNNVNITNIYRNASVVNGATAVNAVQFGQARKGFVTVPRTDLLGANLVRGQLPVAPSRQSLQLGNGPVNTANLPHRPANRQFFTHQQPRSVTRLPFEQQRQAMEQAAKQILSKPPISAQAAGIRPRGSFPSGPPFGSSRQAVGAARDGMTQSSPSAPQSGRPVGVPNGLAHPSPTTRAHDQASGGWARFGNTNRSQALVPPTNAARMDPSQPTTPVAGAGNHSGGLSNGNWSRSEGSTGVHPAAPLSNAGGASADNGWRRFGEPAGGNTRMPFSSPSSMQNSNPGRPASSNQFGAMGSRSQTSGTWSHFGGYAGRGGSGSSVLSINPPIMHGRTAPIPGSARGSYAASRTYESRPAPAYRPNPSHNSGNSHHGGSYSMSGAYSTRPIPSYQPNVSPNAGRDYRPSLSYRASGAYPGSVQSYGASRGHGMPAAPSYRPALPYHAPSPYRTSASYGGGSFHSGGSSYHGGGGGSSYLAGRGGGSSHPSGHSGDSHPKDLHHR